MGKDRVAALSVVIVSLAAVITSSPAAHAAPKCPTVAAVRSAVGSSVTQPSSDECRFRVGERTLTYQIVASSNVAADLNARRQDAVRRTAPVTKTKVGRYPAFTGTASSVSQLFYDQKGTVVYVSHQEINAQSADILKRTAAALARLTIPAKIGSCTAIAKAVVSVVAGARSVPGGQDSCQFILADASTVFVGIQSDQSYADWFNTYAATTDRPPVTDVKVKARHGFAFVTFGTDVVFALDDSIVTVSLDARTNDALPQSLPVKAAAAIV